MICRVFGIKGSDNNRVQRAGFRGQLAGATKPYSEERVSDKVMKTLTLIKNMIKTEYILCWVVLLSFTGSIWADKKLSILAEADVFVNEAVPDVKLKETIKHILTAGIGKNNTKIISYLKFDLSEIPDSTLFHYISIDSGKLSLLAQSCIAESGVRFFVTVNSCPDTTWDDKEMTWNSRACTADTIEGEDSIVIHDNDLPRIYTWDITRSIEKARKRGGSKITYIIDSFPLSQVKGARDIVHGERFGPKDEFGFVRFWSRERVKFGINAVPTLSIKHSSHPTAFLKFLNSTIAILSAIGVAAGLYEFFRRKRGKNKV